MVELYQAIIKQTYERTISFSVPVHGTYCGALAILNAYALAALAELKL